MKNLTSSIAEQMQRFAAKIGSSSYIQALTAGMMATMPITLGVAAFAILANLPFEPWENFIINTGLHGHAMDLIAATSTLTALYVSFTIAYFFGKNAGESGVITGIMSVATFITLMPQSVVAPDGTVIEALSANYLGSEGVFVGMVIALFIGKFYTWLMSKNIKVKLPASVPPMVSESLSPTFVAMILFTFVFTIRVIFGTTPQGNLFDLVNETIAAPIVTFGATPTAGIAVFTLITFSWFFGIHPTAMMSAYLPVMMTAGIANLEAFLAGEPMPFLQFSATMGIIAVGGTGGTLGLAFLMLRAKSERFKALGKMAFIPSLFNINEPYIFGIPLLLNPLFFIPMILSVPVAGLMVHFFYTLGAYAHFNPTVSLPWIMPCFLGAFLVGGWSMMVAIICVIIALGALYLPFFIIADKQALSEEKANEAKLAKSQ